MVNAERKGSLQEKFQNKVDEIKRYKNEGNIRAKITQLRKTKQMWLKKFVYTLAMTTFVFWGAPTFVSVVTFGTCMLVGICCSITIDAK
ncbi:hypothetical protein AHAS_Ahas01G0109600 [Arachis hypogaea]